jgi:hypothetical protein
MAVIASMTVGARAIALALVLLAGGSRRAYADCKPAAVAQGDPALVKALIARLTASGIATTPAPGCPAVQVRLDKRGRQVHVRVTDAFNRLGERDVQDVATAAVIIESWTLQEVDAGTLPIEPPVVATVEATPASPALATRHLVRSGVAASVLSALGSNGTTWVGGAAAACARIGALCAGAALRGERDTRATGDTRTIEQDSYVVSALATLDLPRKLGSFVVSPGIGVGYGWLHVTTHHHDAMNNPLDIPTSDHQLRAGAHVALLRSWSDHLAVFGDLWGELSIARSDAQFGPMGSLRVSFGLRLEAP